MEIYGGEIVSTCKADSSPLTEADLASNQILCDGLAALDPSIPILTEEGAAIPYEERQKWERFWLIDPLDGTKEFISRTGEFTVNVALVVEGIPVMGVVGAPAIGVTYTGSPVGAYRLNPEGRVQIHCSTYDGGPVRVVASRSHAGPETDAWLVQLRTKYPDVELVSIGSSMKFCLVAEGTAHLYPRLGPTMEWDIAAAYAVVAAAGGSVTEIDGQPLAFNKPDLHNPWFLVSTPGLQLPP
jgi:3'(2'), 5'-bisphosphate nucleotidase